jgi:hypothetical protein
MSSQEMVPVVRAGQTARQDFSGAELTVRGETAAVAVAAQAKAAVEARYLLALKQPREWMEVRARLLKECQRPGFAQSGIYRKPIGKDQSKWPTGPSIRFAEAALRSMTNVLPETMVVFEGDDRRIIQVSVTDLEANVTYTAQVVIQKTVERRNPNGEVLGQRKNSYGDDVYILRATEDDLLNKQNAQVSKALRTLALRLLPGDILDECMDVMQATRHAEIKQDPGAAKKRLVDAFESVGIGPTDLAAWLRHSLDRIQPAEIAELREIYSAIKDGEATWEAVMEARGETGSQEQQDSAREKIEAEAKAKLAAMKQQHQLAPAAADEGDPLTEPAPEQPTQPEKPTGRPAGKLQFGRGGAR